MTEDETWSGSFFTRLLTKMEGRKMLRVTSPSGRYEGEVEETDDGVRVRVTDARPGDRRGIMPGVTGGAPRCRRVIHDEIVQATFHVVLDYAHDLVHRWER